MAKKITIAEIKIDGLAQAIDNSISLSDALLQIEGSGKTMSERVEQVNAGMLSVYCPPTKMNMQNLLIYSLFYTGLWYILIGSIRHLSFFPNCSFFFFPIRKIYIG